MRLHSRQQVRLNLLKDNALKVKKIAPSNQILFMVKANAYGHGIEEIVSYSYNEIGISEFGVASLGEALFLRERLPEHQFDLFVFSDLEISHCDNYRHYIDKRLIPVISKKEDLDIILDNSELRFLPVCLKFNTGMNRLGFLPSEASNIALRLKRIGREVYHLMTHMACASQSVLSNKKNIKQQENFVAVKKAFSDHGVSVKFSSISNSGMIEQGAGLEESHIRPGLMMYGPSSLIPQLRETSLYHGDIISSTRSEVIDTFNVEKGEPVGYGATPVPHEGIIGIISLGYGDGISQNYNGYFVRCGKETGRIFGRISMDMIHVLFAKDSEVKLGDEVEIWGHDQESFHKLTDHMKTSGYEVFCQITSRVPRIYTIN